MTSAEVAQFLGINMNNLRQIQYRRSLAWVKKSGRNVYYRKAEVEAYAEKRKGRNKSQYVTMTIVADVEVVTKVLRAVNDVAY